MDDSIKEFQKVQIILHEYNTLRAEVLSRYVAQFQAGGVASIVLLGVFSLFANQGFSYWYVGIGVLDGLLLGAVLFWIDIDIAKAAGRLREIETQVNTVAGETLLRWENKYGLGGIVGKYFVSPPQSN
jgi:tetrahydromethanopterin S-methyltransferase subunit G